MIEPECSIAIEPSVELEPPSKISTGESGGRTESPGRIKSDWWSLRADLKPMSEYRRHRSSVG